MAEQEGIENAETDIDSGSPRIYEVGYHVAPNVKEEDVEKIVGEIRSAIEKEGGSFIAEGAPSQTKLAYAIPGVEAGKKLAYDRAYFGWIKFEAAPSAALALDRLLKANKSVLRHLVFKTVREETRARLKAPTLREVRRTDTIRTTPRRAEESAAPVSEADLDKALEDITAE